MRRTLVTAAAAWPALAAVGQASAQAYPSRPIKVVVAYPPGGVVDIIARAMANPLQAALKEAVVVENRAGAGGVTGHGIVAKSAPDGYTVLLAAAGPLISTKLYKSVPYDPVNDFAPIAMVGETNILFVVHQAMPVNSLQEFIQHARANPGKINMSINSIGSMHHLMSELFMLRSGIKLNRVPYKGAGQVIPDLLAGVVDVHMESLPLIAQYIKAGRLRPLATASNKRLEELPDTPTFAELGFRDVVASPWYAFVAPAGTPRAIIDQLNRAVNTTLHQPELRAQLAKQGVNIVTAPPDETGRFIRAEIDRIEKVIAETGVRTD
ncbi:MAG: tripartite tricarboxylate transporter substrate binding protein [Burkholderiales bacterium]|nr:tripartite tricarboxylate transporter substrate binding protein [Burkholderiales bacterium]